MLYPLSYGRPRVKLSDNCLGSHGKGLTVHREMAATPLPTTMSTSTTTTTVVSGQPQMTSDSLSKSSIVLAPDINSNAV